MVRISKQAERRSQSPRRPRPPSVKMQSQQAQPSKSFKEHVNALTGNASAQAFIPKIR